MDEYTDSHIPEIDHQQNNYDNPSEHNTNPRNSWEYQNEENQIPPNSNRNNNLINDSFEGQNEQQYPIGHEFHNQPISADLTAVPPIQDQNNNPQNVTLEAQPQIVEPIQRQPIKTENMSKFVIWGLSKNVHKQKMNFMLLFMLVWEISFGITFLMLYSDIEKNPKNMKYQIIWPGIDSLFNWSLFLGYYQNTQKDRRKELLCYPIIVEIAKNSLIITCLYFGFYSKQSYQLLIPLIIWFLLDFFNCPYDAGTDTENIYGYYNKCQSFFFNIQIQLLGICIGCPIGKFYWGIYLIPQFTITWLSLIAAGCAFIRLFCITISWICNRCSHKPNYCGDPMQKNNDIPYFFENFNNGLLLIWGLYSTRVLNYVSGNTIYTDDDRTVFDTGSYQNAKNSLICFVVCICFKWLYNFCFVKVDKYLEKNAGLSVQVQQPGAPDNLNVIQPVPMLNNNQVAVIQHGGLVPPIKPVSNYKEKRTGFKRFLSWQPMSGSYFVKNPSEEQQKIVKQKSLNPEEKLCKVCYMNDGNTIVNACGHGGMCDLCAKDIIKKFGSCMMCRQKIDKILVIGVIDKCTVEVLYEITN